MALVTRATQDSPQRTEKLKRTDRCNPPQLDVYLVRLVYADWMMAGSCIS
jgi:hypothetical protein